MHKLDSKLYTRIPTALLPFMKCNLAAVLEVSEIENKLLGQEQTPPQDVLAAADAALTSSFRGFEKLFELWAGSRPL